MENVLSSVATHHPWFEGFARDTGSARFRAIDSRLFDLVPDPAKALKVAPLSFETATAEGEQGEALTGVEFARDPSGTMPRMFGVNHHPEIMDAGRQKVIIETLWSRGEVTKDWYDERMKVLAQGKRDPELAQQLAITTGFTFVWPLRFHIVKNLRTMAGLLNRAFDLHEDDITQRALQGRATTTGEIRVSRPDPAAQGHART